jgi:hypothetical protein
MNTHALFVAACIAAPVAAQGMHVVPQSATSAEGNAMRAFPGIGVGDRLQVIVDAAELQPLVGRTVNGLVLRRDTSFDGALASASGRVVVRIGAAAAAPDAAQRSFVANLPAPVEAFRGAIDAPATGPAPTAPSWDPADTVRVQFAAGFLYAGGPLCVEVESLAAAGVWWPVDAVSDTTVGSVLSVSAACGPRASFGATAGVDPAGLVVGRSATFHLVGAPHAPAWLLVGFGMLSHPLDLGFVGAPGCQLHVDVVAQLPATVSAAIPGFGSSGLVNVDLHLPADANLLGGRVTAQWLELTPALVTSNALSCQIASVPPQLGMAVVASRSGETPDVRAVGVPVLGLLWE